MKWIKKVLWGVACAAALCVTDMKEVKAQTSDAAFKQFQLSFNRVNQAYGKYFDYFKKTFESAGVPFPPKEIYLRSFKLSNELEVWVRPEKSDTFMMFKKYKVCALSGDAGPKRKEGDKQVPEGYYFIDEFNPKSDFYLSLQVSYPNYSDLMLGDKAKPGGDIYIHGGCITVGCLPMTNEGIEEIYTLCLLARANGQTYIPIHIFPTRFNRDGLNYLGKAFMSDTLKQKFWVDLKKGYDYFEKKHLVPPVMYTPEGRYVVPEVGSAFARKVQ